MTVSVVVANYNYGHLASQAIDSVVSQTRKPNDSFFIDDASEGGLDRLLLQTNKYIPMTLRVNPKNVGIVENFNQILMRGEDMFKIWTDYVLFLGADNWLRPDTLELMMLAAEKHGADIVSSDIALVGTESEEFSKGLNTEYKDGYNVWRFKPGNIETGNFIHGSSLYNVKLAQQVGGYEANPTGKHTEEDWMLWKKMIAAGAKHHHIPEPLLYYRRHKANYNKI